MFALKLEMRQLCWTILLLLGISSSLTHEKLKTIYSWKALEFAFPNEHHRQLAIEKGDFIPGAPLPIDVDVYTGGTNFGSIEFSTKISTFQKHDVICFIV